MYVHHIKQFIDIHIKYERVAGSKSFSRWRNLSEVNHRVPSHRGIHKIKVLKFMLLTKVMQSMVKCT